MSKNKNKEKQNRMNNDMIPTKETSIDINETPRAKSNDTITSAEKQHIIILLIVIILLSMLIGFGLCKLLC